MVKLSHPHLFVLLATTFSVAKGQDLDTVLSKLTGAIGDVLTLNTFSLEGVSGEVFANFEAEDPTMVAPLSTYIAEYSFDLEQDFLRVDMEYTPKFEGLVNFPMVPDFTRVLRGDIGVNSAQVIFTQPGPLGSANVASLRRNQYLLNPHILLREALLLADDDGINGGGVVTYNDQESTTETQVLTIPNDVYEISLHVDAVTGFINKLTTMESSPLVRDAPMEIRYTDWSLQSNGISFPARVEMYTLEIQTLVWTEDRMAANVGQVFPADHFDFPPTTGDIPLPPVDPVRYEFGMQSAYANEAFLHLASPYLLDSDAFYAQADELAPGVFIFRAMTVNSMVAMSNGSAVVLEGGQTDVQGVRFVNRIKEVFGDAISVTHVIQSHHHMDHGAGVRTLVGSFDGSRLVVGHGVLEFWKAVLAAPSTIRPDILTGVTPITTPVIELEKLGSLVVMDNADVKVTAIHIDQDPHAEDAVMTVIEAGGKIVIFAADIYNAGIGLTIVNDGPKGLFNAMKINGLLNCACQSVSGNPITFVPTHGMELSLDAAISELSGLGIDVGCQPVSCLAPEPTPAPTLGPTPEPTPELTESEDSSAGVVVGTVLPAVFGSLVALAGVDYEF